MNPIKPTEVIAEQVKGFPPEIIAIWNSLIIKHYRADIRKATIYQDDVLNMIREKLSISNDKIIECRYLDIEQAFEKVGWEVRYHKPAYNETGKSYFEFIGG